MQKLKSIIPLMMFWATTAMGSHAAAANWVPLLEGDDGRKYYYDGSSKVMLGGSIVRVWEKSSGGHVEFLGKIVSQEIALVEYNCTSNSTRVLKIVQYYADGSNYAAEINEVKFRYVTPETILEAKMELICR